MNTRNDDKAPASPCLGLWDESNGCWLGYDDGPLAYENSMEARAAATIVTERFGRVVIPKGLPDGEWLKKGVEVPAISGEEAVRRLEGGGEVITIQWYHAKDNPMFPKELTVLLRFGKTKTYEPCAYCGKKKQTRWTLLCPFKLVDFDKQFLIAQTEPQVFQPCQLVCTDHVLRPEIDPQAMMCGVTKIKTGQKDLNAKTAKTAKV